MTAGEMESHPFQIYSLPCRSLIHPPYSVKNLLQAYSRPIACPTASSYALPNLPKTLPLPAIFLYSISVAL